MSIVRRAAFLVPLLALLACGGSTSRFGQSDAGDDGSPPPGCPSEGYVGGGGACSDDGAQCPGTVTLPTCNGNTSSTTTTCTCASGAWTCPVAVGGIECPVPDPGCPSPSQVTQGAACANTPGTSCLSNIPVPTCSGPSNGFESCTCDSSQWECPLYAGLCPTPTEAGTCPPPSEVWSGQGCETYDTTCQGDPQVCDGTTVYDTLQCSAGAWSVVASTYCDIDDGGYNDAQFGVDAGQGI